MNFILIRSKNTGWLRRGPVHANLCFLVFPQSTKSLIYGRAKQSQQGSGLKQLDVRFQGWAILTAWLGQELHDKRGQRI